MEKRKLNGLAKYFTIFCSILLEKLITFMILRSSDTGNLFLKIPRPGCNLTPLYRSLTHLTELRLNTALTPGSHPTPQCYFEPNRLQVTSEIRKGNSLTLFLMIDLIHQETLKHFREELFAEGILHEGDTIGTNDETLLCVNNRPPFVRTLWNDKHLISGGFCERVDSTWSNPRKCLTIASNGGRL